MQTPAIDADQFDRQKRIAGWNQEAVSKSRVLVVGAGALGNEVVKGLAQIGVERITLVDFDKVVKANLNRCVFFCPRDAANGEFKARVISKRIRSVNKKTQVRAVIKKAEELGEDFYSNFDVAFSCLDNIGARLHVNANCYGKAPLIDGGTTGFFGKVQVACSPSSCLECAMSRQDYQLLWRKYSCLGDPLDFMDPKTPALSTTNSIVAALQVNEFVKLVHSNGLIAKPHKAPRLAGESSTEKTDSSWLLGSTLVGKYLYYDGIRNTQMVFSVARRADCPVHA